MQTLLTSNDNDTRRNKQLYRLFSKSACCHVASLRIGIGRSQRNNLMVSFIYISCNGCGCVVACCVDFAGTETRKKNSNTYTIFLQFIDIFIIFLSIFNEVAIVNRIKREQLPTVLLLKSCWQTEFSFKCVQGHTKAVQDFVW